MTDELTDRLKDRRRVAQLCRRMASVRTSGGFLADRALLALAEKLDPQTERLRPLRNDNQFFEWQR